MPLRRLKKNRGPVLAEYGLAAGLIAVLFVGVNTLAADLLNQRTHVPSADAAAHAVSMATLDLR